LAVPGSRVFAVPIIEGSFLPGFIGNAERDAGSILGNGKVVSRVARRIVMASTE
jgi:hypothetical protein